MGRPPTTGAARAAPQPACGGGLGICSTSPPARGLHLFVAPMRRTLMLRIFVWIGFVLLVTEACLKKCKSESTVHRLPPQPKRAPHNFSTVVGKYATYEETMRWYESLADANKGLVKLIPIGLTYEGRTQVVMRISPYPRDPFPAIFIEGGMHAREWLSPSTANFLIEKLIKSYNRGDNWARSAMNTYVFYIMSITNPDGYVFTFDKSNSENRFWRKNRRLNPNGCVGVDLNRNWDIAFGGKGTSANPCSEIYRGNSAFSEPETENIRRFAMKKFYRRGRSRPGLQLYISLHTYAQLWIVPYSYNTQRPANDFELHRAALVAAKATEDATGQAYNVRNGAQAFGVTTAGSDDWMLAKMHARYSYTLELRPSEKVGYWKRGFDRPKKDIIPTGRDALAALKALIKTMQIE